MLGHQQFQSCNQGVMMWILFVKYGISNESVKSQSSVHTNFLPYFLQLLNLIFTDSLLSSFIVLRVCYLRKEAMLCCMLVALATSSGSICDEPISLFKQ